MKLELNDDTLIHLSAVFAFIFLMTVAICVTIYNLKLVNIENSNLKLFKACQYER